MPQTNFERVAGQVIAVLLLSLFVAFICAYLAMELTPLWHAVFGQPKPDLNGFGAQLVKLGVIFIVSFLLSAFGFWRYREKLPLSILAAAVLIRLNGQNLG